MRERDLPIWWGLAVRVYGPWGGVVGYLGLLAGVAGGATTASYLMMRYPFPTVYVGTSLQQPVPTWIGVTGLVLLAGGFLACGIALVGSRPWKLGMTIPPRRFRRRALEAGLLGSWIVATVGSVIAGASTSELWWQPLAQLAILCFVGVPLALFQARS